MRNTSIQSVRKVPLVVPHVGDEEIAAVERVLRSGQLAQGPEVAAFEREFASAVGSAHAVAVNSGTAANHALLEAFGVGEGDIVLTTPFTFAATATPIVMQGARPRFVDVDPRTFNLDTTALVAAASSDVRAAVVVDLFGLPMDLDAVATLRSRGVKIVEDSCQAIGASANGISAGCIGDGGSFSFYATKNLMTGEGGMLTTNDPAVDTAARRFRQHGMGEQYQYLSLGYNYRMTDVAAAIGRVQMTRLHAITQSRRANAARYDAGLAGVAGVTTPFVPSGYTHAYHQYSILIDSAATKNGATRDAVRAQLAERGIGSGIYYPKPLHLHPLFAKYGYGPGDFPVAERIATQILALPIHPALETGDVDYTIASIRSAVGVDA